MFESNEKVKTLCETVSKLELQLEDVVNRLELSNEKCEELSKENYKLRGTEDDLSKQVNYLKTDLTSLFLYVSLNIFRFVSYCEINNPMYVLKIEIVEQI